MGKSFLHVTVSSTTLYEAALFGTPTILLPYRKYKDIEIYGFKVKYYRNFLPDEFLVMEKYEDYLSYIKNKTVQYM